MGISGLKMCGISCTIQGRAGSTHICVYMRIKLLSGFPSPRPSCSNTRFVACVDESTRNFHINRIKPQNERVSSITINICICSCSKTHPNERNFHDHTNRPTPEFPDVCFASSCSLFLINRNTVFNGPGKHP